MRNKGKIYLSIVAISFLQGLQYVVSPVLGDIQANYPEISVDLVQMLVTGPALLSMAVALLSGWLVRFVSKKKLVVFAAFLSGLAGFLPYLSDSFWLLFFSRIVYGAGLGIASTMNLAVVAQLYGNADLSFNIRPL